MIKKPFSKIFLLEGPLKNNDSGNQSQLFCLFVVQLVCADDSVGGGDNAINVI